MFFKKFLNNILPKREQGQGLVEYALILVLVAVVVIAILLILGPAIGQVYCRVANALQAGSCTFGSGSFTGVTVTSGMGNQQTVSFTVSQPTSGITVNTTAGTPQSPPSSCSGTCSFNITGLGVGSHGAVTISGTGTSAGTGSISGSW
jgi:pilus assembly protein Flp/PilA